MKVEVVRSPRRRKTVQAREVDGVLRVSIPAAMTAADEARWVEEMVRRMERRSGTELVDLDRRAALLARRYRLERPTSITWATNQEWRWGSCTPTTGTVRVSSRLAQEPSWVLDYVIVHELAHLSIPRHDRRFWALVNRYPLTERARGFLIARGREPGEGTADEETDKAAEPQPPASGSALSSAATPTRLRSSRRRQAAGPPSGQDPAGGSRRQETAAAGRKGGDASRASTGKDGRRRRR